MHCGMHSHSSHVRSDESIKELTPEECRAMHESRRLDLYGRTVHNLKMNGSTPATLVVAGSISSDGSCRNADEFIDGPNTYKNVNVEIRVRINLYTTTAKLDIQTGILNLRSGLSAPYRDGRANDVITGQSFWSVGPPETQDCSETRYNPIYEGVVRELVSSSPSGGKFETYIVVDQDDTTFSVKLMDAFLRCGRRIYSTEHPFIYVTYGDTEPFFFQKKANGAVNADIFTFFQSKLQFMEARSRSDIQSLHMHGIRKRCELERGILANKLATLRMSPDAAGTLLFAAARGIHSVVRGESLYSMECRLTSVQLRATRSCFNAIPVTYKNQSMFLAPLTHILTQHAEETPCSRAAPNLFELAPGYWLALTPDPVDVKSNPKVLRPTPDLELSFREIRHVANRGIFSQDDMRELEKSMLFPIQRTAVTSYVANRILGNSPNDQFDPLNVFGPKEMARIADTTLRRVYGWLSDFGVLSSGVIGIIFCIQLVKYFCSVGLRVFHLRRELGCGLWLLGAIWSSLSYCLLHNHIKRQFPVDEEATEAKEETPKEDKVGSAPPHYQIYQTPFTFPSDDPVKCARPRPRPVTVSYPVLPESVQAEQETVPEVPAPATGSDKPYDAGAPLPPEPPSRKKNNKRNTLN